MKTLLALVLIGVFVEAHAAPKMLVAESPELTVRLFASECKSEKVLKRLEALHPPKNLTFQAGNETYQGRELEACWTAVSADTVVVIDEEGDGGQLPIAVFKPVDGI